MDWLTIASLVISAGALVTYWATAETPKARQRDEHQLRDNYAWTSRSARPADPDVIDRFTKAFKARSRPTA